ncbi:MAG: metallophosphoesterase, partial [Oligoflexia bacterium]|nr:metallophosphoesterase [Oligoflexia bacterium]
MKKILGYSKIRPSNWWNIPLLAMTMVLFFVVEVGAYVPGKIYPITILHTNDSHGSFWRDNIGQFGFSAQKTLVGRIRQEVLSKGGHLLILSAGDFNTGKPRSDMQHAIPDLLALNSIGYDAMCIGNHEFDKGLQALQEQESLAQFPFLAANIYYDTENSPRKLNVRVFKPYIQKTFDELKVSIIGLITETTPYITESGRTDGLFFRSALEEAKEIVPLLRKESDIVVALTHLGFTTQDPRSAGDETLAGSGLGIDLIVGGHEHLRLFEPVIKDKTIIVQAGDQGKYLGRLDLEFLDGQVRIVGYKLIAINQKVIVTSDNGTPVLDAQGNPQYRFVNEEIVEDPDLLQKLQFYYDKGGEELAKVVGTVEGYFTRSRS